MRFLNLSIRADHAASFPFRHSCTNREFGHRRSFARVRSSGLWSSGLARFLLAQEKLLRIPKRVVVQIGGSKVAQARLGSHQDVRADQANERKILSHQLLDPV